MALRLIACSRYLMKVIGLTGGIATGKTTVRKMFENHGVPCIDADVLAREVVEPGTSAYKKIISSFGEDVLQPGSGSRPIDRAKLGSIIFEDAEKRKTLNRITHTAVRNRMIQLLAYYFVVGEPSVLLDVPLLYETGMDKMCSKVIVIYVPPALQLSRLHERNPDLGDEAEKRIASQMSTDEKRKRTTLIIDNSGSLADTEAQVAEMFRTEFPQSRLFTIRNFILLGSSLAIGGVLYTQCT